MEKEIAREFFVRMNIKKSEKLLPIIFLRCLSEFDKYNDLEVVSDEDTLRQYYQL